MATAAIDLALHPGQQRIWDSPARHRIAPCGRRFGKTLMAVAVVAGEAIRQVGDYLWAAPVHDQSSTAWDTWNRVIHRGLFDESLSNRFKALRNGSRVYFRSAERPDNIRGRGYAGVVVDECAQVAQVAWEEAIQPCLLDTGGWALLIGTPKGRNWFYREYLKGQSDEWPDHASFNARSDENPYLGRVDLEDMRRSLPEMVARQELDAEFLDDSGTVFRGVDACIVDGLPTNGGPYVAGVDLAKHQDWTVVVVMHQPTRRVVDVQRFNQLDWPVQKKRIADIVKHWKAAVTIDATGAGDPIYDDLRRAGLHIRPFKFTQTTKVQLVQQLMVAIEEGAVSFPPHPELVNELKAYAYEMTASGNISYNAPTGLHDDCVMALGLALQGSMRPTSWGVAI